MGQTMFSVGTAQNQWTDGSGGTGGMTGGSPFPGATGGTGGVTGGAGGLTGAGGITGGAGFFMSFTLQLLLKLR
jgi:hypothetical protein